MDALAGSNSPRSGRPPQERLRAWFGAIDDRTFLLLVVAAGVLLRLPFAFAPLGIDEGGLAYVATRWLESSGSLYGDQWVDRPPLLIAFYVLANLLGGAVALRVLGMLAASVTIVACASVAGRVAGPVALRWSALATLALTSSTMLQGQTVNAELPALALTSTSAWLVVRAMTARPARGSRYAFAAGIAATSAMLVKQSFADGFAFAGAALLTLAIVGAPADRRRAARVLAGGVAGTAVVVAAFVSWASTYGPGTRELVDALYGFRVEAGAVLESTNGRELERAWLLFAVVVACGMFALLAYVLLGTARLVSGAQRVDAALEPVLVRAVAAGVAAMALFGIACVLAGGSWWTHYLLQPVPAIAIGTGLVIAAGPGRTRSRVARHTTWWAVAATAVATISWIGAADLAARGALQRRPVVVGDWLGRSARDGDTAMVVWGHANVLERTGMRSPYPMSWSLPIRVRDPDLRELRRVLAGEDAPTWLVRWNPLNSWGIDEDGHLRTLIVARYETIATVCGVRIMRLEAAGPAGSLPPIPPDGACAVDGGVGIDDLLARLQ